MVLGPIAKGLGAEYTSGNVEDSRRSPKRKGKGKSTLDRTDPEAIKRAQSRDQQNFLAAAQAGIRIYED